MASRDRRARPARLLLVALTAVLLATGGSLTRPAPAAALSAWTGGVDLYRTGTFTTQQTWLWCTAASVQLIRNIVRHESDHTRSGQRRYYDYMRAHNRYNLPPSAGVDPVAPGLWSD